MKTITLTVADDLVPKITDLEPAVLSAIIEKGLRAYEAEQALDNYLSVQRPFENERDVLAAAHEAKERSHALFEDQGLAAIALFFSDTLAHMLRGGPGGEFTPEHPMTELVRS